MKLVKGVGNKDSDIVFVGEAPGRDEEIQGIPFVGSAGRKLDECMKKSGILRSTCYLTNVVKERPDGNIIKPFIDLAKGNTPVSAKYEMYEDALKEELEGCKANVIVAVGAVPLWALTRQKGVTKRRGSIYESTLVRGKKVIPVIHPAAALRNYLWTHLIVHDLKRVVEESYYPEVSLPKRYLKIAPTFTESMEALCQLENAPLVGFDIEVLNEEVSCISFATSPHAAISIPFMEKGREYFSPDQELAIWRKIAQVLENRSIVKLGQNVIFDSTFLYNKYGIRTAPMEDTMIAHATVFPDFPKGLDFLTSMYTREPYYKDEGKFRIKTGGGSDEQFWIYNAKDSVVLMEIFPKLIEDLAKLGNLETYKRQMKMVEALVYMGARGIRMDVKAMKEKSNELENTIELLNNAIVKMSDGVIQNPNSTKEVKQYFYVEKGITPYRNKGAITVDGKALSRLASRGFEVASHIQNVRKAVKKKGTYADMMLDTDNRMRCSFNPVGTVNGRLSSSKTIFGTGANMQNQPHWMKKFMLADEGYVIYEMDLSQAENRIVAYISPEQTMIEAFENGEDIHSKTAGLIFGKLPDDISKEDGSSQLGNGEQSERFWGKTCNHALNYKMGSGTFSLEYEIPMAEAKALSKKYNSVYPGIRMYHGWIQTELREGLTLTNLFGRKRFFLDRWSDELLRQGYNFIPQSTVADMINDWGINYIYYNQDIFRYMELINQVHDSLVFQIPVRIGWDKHAEMITALKKSLEQTLKFRLNEFNIPVELNMGLNLYDTEEIDLTQGGIDGRLEASFHKLNSSS